MNGYPSQPFAHGRVGAPLPPPPPRYSGAARPASPAAPVASVVRPNGPAPQVSAETLALARVQVRDLLSRSPAFRAMPPDQQRQIAMNTVDLVTYLVEPDGVQATALPTAQAMADLEGARSRRADPNDPGRFTAQGASEGARVAGALLQAVNFPAFVSGLVTGVFHSIVESSIKQMEAYGKLVADVAKTLNQFRDENVSPNQGRDFLVDQFPDLFQISVDTGDPFGEGGGPRVQVRDGVDEGAALQRVNQLPVEGGPVRDLSDETIEGRLVPAARNQLATSRQQLLATMVLMGINRIVVTDGRISAKVLYDFQARDTFSYRNSATRFDYGDQYVYKGAGTTEVDQQGGSRSYSKDKDETTYDRDYGSYYAKGTYQYENSPVLTLASATQAATDAALQTRASLAGQVEINFKSETFPLERMADSFQIGRIQDAARPASPSAGTGAGGNDRQPASGAQPVAPANTAPPPSSAAPPAGR